MNTKSCAIRRSLLVMSAGVVLLASGEICLSQNAEQKEKKLSQVQILLGAEGLDVVSPAIKRQILEHTEQRMLPPGTESVSELHSPDNPGIGSHNRPSSETRYFREQLSQQIDFLAQQGNDVQQLRELVERLQLGLQNSENRTTRDVEVAVFAVGEAAQEGPEGPHHQGFPRTGISFTGPSGFSPPGMRMRGRPEMHPGEGPQIHHPEANRPAGPFAEDRKRIAALTESAERITQAGLPDVAHGLRERAGQLERELAEKQERMQQEERKRMESELREQRGQIRPQTQHLMEHRREGIEIELVGHPTPALRELHEQMEQLRHDMHKLSEQMADLTRLSSKRHNPKNDADDEDADDEDGDDDDRKERGEQKEE